jgi:hypothetical protein
MPPRSLVQRDNKPRLPLAHLLIVEGPQNAFQINVRAIRHAVRFCAIVSSLILAMGSMVLWAISTHSAAAC